jgi:hypothetical protein
MHCAMLMQLDDEPTPHVLKMRSCLRRVEEADQGKKPQTYSMSEITTWFVPPLHCAPTFDPFMTLHMFLAWVTFCVAVSIVDRIGNSAEPSYVVVPKTLSRSAELHSKQHTLLMPLPFDGAHINRLYLHQSSSSHALQSWHPHAHSRTT